jgi:twitching motility protein PilT
MAEVDPWLRRMLELKGSDLHLRAGAPPMWRIHGHLGPIEGEPKIDQERMGRLMQELLPPHRWERFTKTLDMDFAYALGDEARFRVNYFHQLRGHGCVLRHIPAKVLTLEELKTPKVLRQLPHYRDGLVLVTGPTGSGKSTTQAAIVDEINRHYHKHIITIEDPIEFVHQNLGSIITQREVGADTPEFAQALKDSLREDPDVILVGEMRDLETIALAITLAETGVLIFGTLHTNSAAKTIDRVIDVFPASRQQQVRTMFAMSLRAIVAQQLLRRADTKGRIAAHEILISSNAVANIIREGRTEKIVSYIQSGRDEGMITMDATLQNYLDQDWISGEEAFHFAQDKTRFQQYFHHEPQPEPEPEPEETLEEEEVEKPAKKPAAASIKPTKAQAPAIEKTAKAPAATLEKPVKPPAAPEQPSGASPSQEGWG